MTFTDYNDYFNSYMEFVEDSSLRIDNNLYYRTREIYTESNSADNKSILIEMCKKSKDVVKELHKLIENSLRESKVNIKRMELNQTREKIRMKKRQNAVLKGLTTMWKVVDDLAVAIIKLDPHGIAKGVALATAPVPIPGITEGSYLTVEAFFKCHEEYKKLVGNSVTNRITELEKSIEKNELESKRVKEYKLVLGKIAIYLNNVRKEFQFFLKSAWEFIKSIPGKVKEAPEKAKKFGKKMNRSVKARKRLNEDRRDGKGIFSDYENSKWVTDKKRARRSEEMRNVKIKESGFFESDITLEDLFNE